MVAENTDSRSWWYGLGAFVFCLMPWVYVQYFMSVNGDVAWLSISAGRFLQGQSLTKDYFDNNPPMSVMIYVPVVWLGSLGLKTWYAAHTYFMFVVLSGFALTAFILSRWRGIDKMMKWGVFCGYAVVCTYFAQFEFGQKDHLIAVTIVPFVLAQYAKTAKMDVPDWILKASFLLGTPFILMKPHYGLLATMMLMHRFYRQRRFSIVFDFDFMALSIGVVMYVFAIIIWFPDFLSEGLPTTLALYVSETFGLIQKAALGLLLFILLSGIPVIFSQEGEARILTAIIVAMAMASTVAVLVQMKGYSVHLLPVAAFMFPVVVIIGLSLLDFSRIPDNFRGASLVLVVFGLAALISPLRTSFPTHDDYLKTTLAKYINENTSEDGSFFIQAGYTNIVQPLAVYTGVRHAMRFPSLWFLPSLAAERASGRDEYPDKHAEYIAEDIERFDPAFVALIAEPAPATDFLGVFGSNSKFQDAWSKYHFKEQIEIDYAEYFTGAPNFYKDKIVYPTRYDIYVRRK